MTKFIHIDDIDEFLSAKKEIDKKLSNTIKNYKEKSFEEFFDYIGPLTSIFFDKQKNNIKTVVYTIKKVADDDFYVFIVPDDDIVLKKFKNRINDIYNVDKSKEIDLNKMLHADYVTYVMIDKRNYAI